MWVVINGVPTFLHSQNSRILYKIPGIIFFFLCGSTYNWVSVYTLYIIYYSTPFCLYYPNLPLQPPIMTCITFERWVLIKKNWKLMTLWLQSSNIKCLTPSHQKVLKSHLHLIMLLLKEPQKYKKSKFFLRYKNMALKSRLQYLNSYKINKHYTSG